MVYVSDLGSSVAGFMLDSNANFRISIGGELKMSMLMPSAHEKAVIVFLEAQKTYFPMHIVRLSKLLCTGVLDWSESSGTVLAVPSSAARSGKR